MSNSPDPYDLVGAAREVDEVLEQLEDQYPDLIRPIRARFTHAIALAAPLSKEILTPGELAAEWHVNVSTVRALIRDGDLEAFNIGLGTQVRWRIMRPNALRFAELRRNRPQSASLHEAS